MNTYIVQFLYKEGNGWAIVHANRISDIEPILKNQSQFKEISVTNIKEAKHFGNSYNSIVYEGAISTSPVVKTPYDLAVENGFVGTIEEWLNSLKGKDGKDGASANETKKRKKKMPQGIVVHRACPFSSMDVNNYYYHFNNKITIRVPEKISEASEIKVNILYQGRPIFKGKINEEGYLETKLLSSWIGKILRNEHHRVVVLIIDPRMLNKYVSYRDKTEELSALCVKTQSNVNAGVYYINIYLYKTAGIRHIKITSPNFEILPDNYKNRSNYTGLLKPDLVQGGLPYNCRVSKAYWRNQTWYFNKERSSFKKSNIRRKDFHISSRGGYTNPKWRYYAIFASCRNNKYYNIFSGRLFSVKDDSFIFKYIYGKPRKEPL